MTLEYIQTGLYVTHRNDREPEIRFSLSLRTNSECSADSELDCNLDLDDIRLLVKRLQQTINMAAIQRKALNEDADDKAHAN